MAAWFMLDMARGWWNRRTKTLVRMGRVRAMGNTRNPGQGRHEPVCITHCMFKCGAEDFAGMSLVTLREPVLNPQQRAVKRGLDVVLTGLLLIPALPVMGTIILAIKLDSPGPALFRQTRVGEKGRLFQMLKFRSMVVDADQRLHEVVRNTEGGGVVYKCEDDPRVTPVGRFLRRTSLDELPQLFNVLRGEMSLVGPRPELPWLVERYEPWQRTRLGVPQGITGWWQINGRSDKPMHLHTEDDLYYIKNYSLLLDLQILWKTITAVIRRQGAY